MNQRPFYLHLGAFGQPVCPGCGTVARLFSKNSNARGSAPREGVDGHCWN